MKRHDQHHPSRKAPKRRPTELVSFAELGRRKGVSRATAARAARGPLAAAVVDLQIDAGHPLVVEWLGSAATQPTAPPSKKGLPTREQFTRVSYRKRVAEADRLELANAERRGQLISREAVRTHIVGVVHSAFERLLRDVPRTWTARLVPMVKSGEDNEVLERTARELITNVLQPAKDQAARVLRKLAGETTTEQG